METALYLPVKRFLENLGFTVKGEVGGCDLVALSPDDPPIVVIGELKLSFNLELVLQAVDRAGAADEVWLAARMSARGKGRESDARYRNLCRRLGFGMLAVTNTGDVEVIVKPPTTSPRRNPKKRSRLISEHQRRKGDPALGASTRSPIMTAYRQQALACASALSEGPRRVRDLKPGIPDAPKTILAPIEEAYQAITDDALVQRWMAPHNCIIRSARTRPEAGGEFRVEVEDSKNTIHIASGKYLEVKSPNRVVQEWIYEGPGQPGKKIPSGKVAFDLHSTSERETEVTITHDGLPNAEEVAAMQDGWKQCLDKLEKLFHGGE